MSPKIRTATALLSLSLMTSAALAQNFRAGGLVTDADGEPVAGAAVIEEGTANGVSTDVDGNFSLEVSPGAKLLFSCIGFSDTTEDAAPEMKVVMRLDTRLLDEVVVTGYTVQRKSDLTGAISVVNVDELSKRNENNPMKALQGQIPGMNISADGSPSGAATVRIRGIGTLNDNDPLYIIDGVPTKAGMHELNSGDIESVQILKDAASASIYGSRAANGVIVITTKKGKEGKLKLDFDASASVQTYVNRMSVLNSREYGRVMWQAYVNDGMDPNTNGLGYSYDWGYDASGMPVLNGIRMRKYLDSANTVPAADTDWFKETTRTGFIQNYGLSVSRGSDRGGLVLFSRLLRQPWHNPHDRLRQDIRQGEQRFRHSEGQAFDRRAFLVQPQLRSRRAFGLSPERTPVQPVAPGIHGRRGVRRAGWRISGQGESGGEARKEQEQQVQLLEAVRGRIRQLASVQGVQRPLDFRT